MPVHIASHIAFLGLTNPAADLAALMLSFAIDELLGISVLAARLPPCFLRHLADLASQQAPTLFGSASCAYSSKVFIIVQWLDETSCMHSSSRQDLTPALAFENAPRVQFFLAKGNACSSRKRFKIRQGSIRLESMRLRKDFRPAFSDLATVILNLYHISRSL